MKKILALVAIVVWQAITATNSQGQQRPGAAQAGRSQSTANKNVVRKAKPSGTTQSAKTPTGSGVVRPAGHMVTDGEIIHEPSVFDNGGGCTSGNCGGNCGGSCGSSCESGCDSGIGCGSCSVGGVGDLCHQNYGRVYISLPAHGWVHAEGLTWYPSGMRLPALLTTSPVGTQRQVGGIPTAGVLGRNGTSVLFGDDTYLNDATGGFRIRFGTWLGSVPRLGIEGEYVGMSEKSETFSATSSGRTGSQILARPFFNSVRGLEDAQMVAFPNLIRGTYTANINSDFDGAAFRFRRQLCCDTGCGYSDWTCQTVPVSTRTDLTAGYRYWQLNEGLHMNEQLTELTTAGADTTNTFNINDRFRTYNQFNGAELGAIWQGRRGWWSLDALMRVGIGNVHQKVVIDGSTVIREGATTTTHNNAGLLVQRTNAGTFTRDKFTMIPEFGATLGYQLTRRMRATLGYSLIYWGNVVRPGEQIDRIVNPNLLPPETVPFAGAERPKFDFVQTDYWIHGLSYGLDFRW